MEYKLILTKVFTEIRFSPSILYTDPSRRNILVNKYREEYENIQFDDSGKIEAHDNMNKTIVTFYNNRIIVDTDKFNNYDHLKQTAETAIERYSELFDVSIFNRIGIRFNYGLPFNNIGDVIKLISDNFFSILANNALIDLGTIDSQQVFLSFKSDGQKYNVGIYPVTLTNIESTPLKSKQDVYYLLTYDVDYFRDGKVKLADCLSDLSNSEKFVLTKIKNIIKLMGVALDEH